MSTPFLSDLDLLHAAERLLEEARHDGLPPVCLAICNADGQLAFFLRMDGAPVRLIAIAQAKAYTAARMGSATADFARRFLRQRPDRHAGRPASAARGRDRSGRRRQRTQHTGR